MAGGLLLAFAAATVGQPALAPFSPLVGRCWVAEFAPGMTDTHCFTAPYGGQHVRDTHEVVVAGKTVYSGETLYSVEGAGIGFTYWNSTGGIGHGAVRAAGPVLTFSGTMKGTPAGKSITIETRWRLGEGIYEVQDGKAKPTVFRPAPLKS